ncbi:MAG: hypothetical protein COC06_02305 [Bacteroidales bacterium]|nr:MAG: hypothetical protein COC06_02305 [Bacteroidales bacterium]
MNSKLMALALLATALVACNKDDNGSQNLPSNGDYFAVVSGESAQYVMQLDDLSANTSYVISDNIDEMETSYTWIFGGSPRTAIGLAYSQGDPAPGRGYIMDDNGDIVSAGSEFLLLNRFTSSGFYGNYGVTNASRVTPIDEDGGDLSGDDLYYKYNGKVVCWNSEGGVNWFDNSTYKEDSIALGDGTLVPLTRTDGVVYNFIDLDNRLAVADEIFNSLGVAENYPNCQATLAGVADFGESFLCGMVLHYPRELKGTVSGGQSIGQIPNDLLNSCFVAEFTYDGTTLTHVRTIGTDKMGYASGRFRSRNYPLIYTHEDGDVYVFSGAYEASSTVPAACMRIPANGTAFDSYYFDIQNATNGGKFQRVWYAGGDKFLALFYEVSGDTSSSANRFAIIDVAAQTVTPVSGDFPKEYDSFASEPMVSDGKCYLPINVSTEQPAIYIIDTETGVTTKGAEITGAQSINALGFMGR